MTSLQDRISLLADGGREFAAWCEEALGSGSGAQVLAQLFHMEDPLTSPDRGNERDTCIAIGRREVIALLWRVSQSEITPGNVPKKLC